MNLYKTLVGCQRTKDILGTVDNDVLEVTIENDEMFGKVKIIKCLVALVTTHSF